MEKTDKGYEVDGLNIWYHPFRLDMYPGLRKRQLANLRALLGDEAATVAIREDESRRRQGDSRNVNHLKLIRGHHIQNGGVVYDMAKLAPHLEATWADDIVLDHVEMTKGFYVHFGDTLEYDRENPASLIEGVYVTHVDGEERGWMLTFVTNYPDWADAEKQMPSMSERHFGSNFSFILPEGFDVAQGDYSKLQIISDRELAAKASIWHLGRLATNAMLYLNRPRPDVWGSLTTYNMALDGTNRTQIYDCGCDEVDWNIDWNDTVLRPGRWRVVETGGDGRPPLLVEWVPPKVVYAAEASMARDGGAVVLEFKNRKRQPTEGE
jgi:hypothetical protein